MRVLLLLLLRRGWIRRIWICSWGVDMGVEDGGDWRGLCMLISVFGVGKFGCRYLMFCFNFRSF